MLVVRGYNYLGGVAMAKSIVRYDPMPEPSSSNTYHGVSVILVNQWSIPWKTYTAVNTFTLWSSTR